MDGCARQVYRSGARCRTGRCSDLDGEREAAATDYGYSGFYAGGGGKPAAALWAAAVSGGAYPAAASLQQLQPPQRTGALPADAAGTGAEGADLPERHPRPDSLAV